MKNVLIVLLVAAIGAGVYFYFSKKQQASPPVSRELILGKWKIDSLVFKKDSSKAGNLFSHLFDSSLHKYEVEFRKDSLVLQTNDERVEDTSHYELADGSTLLISHNNGDDKEKFNISKLDSSVMIANDKDSTVFYFRRIKK